jgi:RNA polymerase sigma-70 factor (ECF subfamily)
MDRELARRDHEARLAAIFRRYAPDVLAYALRRCSPEDAPDVVSETFVVAWRRIGDVPEEPAVKAWLLGVARRVLANQRRGHRRRGDLVRKVSAHLPDSPPQPAAIEHRAETEQVVEAMRTLSPADQEVLMLAAWEELTPAEIATTLGVSGGVARKRLFRARKRLAAEVERLDGERRAESGHLQGRSRTGHLGMGKGVST